MSAIRRRLFSVGQYEFRITLCARVPPQAAHWRASASRGAGGLINSANISEWDFTFSFA